MIHILLWNTDTLLALQKGTLINALTLQSQIFTLIQAQLIGETWMLLPHTCRTDATEPWGSANTSLPCC